MMGLSLFQLIVLAVFATIYFIPLLVAVGRKKQRALAIGALNTLAGWTVIGWVAALIWACLKDKTPEPDGVPT